MRAFALVALVVAASVGEASACGVCIEDKIAATYDYAVVTRAIGRGHVVVFAEPRVHADAAFVARKLAAAASQVRGVDAGSVRTADSPLALAFALDPHVASPAQALIAVKKRAGVAGLELVPLREMR